jgi:ribosomal protein S18 acetylase RimI-like enzyme
MTEVSPDGGPHLDFRNARQEDYEFTEALYLETMKPRLIDLGAWNEREVIANFRGLFKPKEVRIILADGLDAGWLQTTEHDHSINLIQIHLKEQFRSAGIGSRLIRDLLRDAKSRKKSVALSVVRNNPALALYRRLGFKIVSSSGYKIHMLWDFRINDPDQ